MYLQTKYGKFDRTGTALFVVIKQSMQLQMHMQRDLPMPQTDRQTSLP